MEAGNRKYNIMEEAALVNPSSKITVSPSLLMPRSVRLKSASLCIEHCCRSVCGIAGLALNNRVRNLGIMAPAVHLVIEKELRAPSSGSVIFRPSSTGGAPAAGER